MKEEVGGECQGEEKMRKVLVAFLDNRDRDFSDRSLVTVIDTLSLRNLEQEPLY
jgi:hypothetical protein